MVERLENTVAVRTAVSAARESGRRIGLVPTMGALHAGHARLIERCHAQTGITIVSIFVNPTQFGPREDFSRYPRALENDLQVCEASGATLVFAPSIQTMYPHGLESTSVEVPQFANILEGASRPNHFRGVATVVLKLFEIVRPDLACFGQKDYQQQLVIRRMVADLHQGVEIDTCPTIREEDGLAMSSRNRYLSPDEREAAAVLFRALENARTRRDRRRAASQSGSTDSRGNDRIRAARHARLCRAGQRRIPGAARASRRSHPRRRAPCRPHRQHPPDRQHAPERLGEPQSKIENPKSKMGTPNEAGSVHVTDLRRRARLRLRRLDCGGVHLGNLARRMAGKA